MSKLPVVSGQELCRILKKTGYVLDHQTGSHIILRNGTPPFRRLTVLNHKEIARGTLRAILRQAGLTLDEFKELVKTLIKLQDDRLLASDASLKFKTN